jgi:thiol-disulfide isomerase/thioredoxin
MLHSPSINRRTVLKRSLVLLVFACSISQPRALLAEESFKALKIGSVPPGTVAAPFELKSLEGKSVPMRQFAGKLVVLNFWATWCGPCKEEMPAFERLRQKVDPERVSLLTVTTDLQRDGIKHFLGSLDVHLPVLFDEDQEVSRAYMVRALPTTVIIDRQGMVVGRALGPRDWDSPEAVRYMEHLLE